MSSLATDKRRYPRAQAIEVARFLTKELNHLCERLVFAGSLRRGKPDVGDIEVLYIPKVRQDRDGLFDTIPVSLVEERLEALIKAGILAMRQNSVGSVMWGPKNKLAIFVHGGVPIDFFATDEASWWNYLVCRTGGAQTNIRIAKAAQAKGWQWMPYGPGFRDQKLDRVRVHSEREVFELVGLPYLEPHQRD